MKRKEIVLKVIDICGRHCFDRNQAEPLFLKALYIIEQGDCIQLDFTGIETVISSFLNGGVGRLVTALGLSKFAKRVTWKGLDQVDTELVELVIQNAKDYLKKGKTFQSASRNAVNEIEKVQRREIL